MSYSHSCSQRISTRGFYLSQTVTGTVQRQPVRPALPTIAGMLELWRMRKTPSHVYRARIQSQFGHELASSAIEPAIASRNTTVTSASNMISEQRRISSLERGFPNCIGRVRKVWVRDLDVERQGTTKESSFLLRCADHDYQVDPYLYLKDVEPTPRMAFILTLSPQVALRASLVVDRSA